MFQYYYIYDSPDGRKTFGANPIATVCLAVDRDGAVVRGTAICSPADQFSRKEGRRIARNRVLKAMGQRASSEPISSVFSFVMSHTGEHKCEYGAKVIAHEEKLVERLVSVAAT